MMRSDGLLVCTLLLLASHYGSADAELTTDYLISNGLNFTCTILKHASENPDAEQKNLLLFHGFPNSRDWWTPLLQHWDNLLMDDEEDSNVFGARKNDNSVLPPVSLHAVACDLRGYSPGASPDGIEEYTYPKLAEDGFGLAEAAGFRDGFHLLGHDHGAGLGWYMAANDPNNQVLSYTSMALPHLQQFSDALCGDNIDPDQVIAGNYLNQLSLPDSATVNDGALPKKFKTFLGLDPYLEPAQFQKWLWWYAAMGKAVSYPAVVSDEMVGAYEGNTFFVELVRSAIPLEERPCNPIDDKVPVGAVGVKTMLICGVQDTALLCSHPYSADYPTDLLPHHEHVNFECGHNFFEKGHCDSMEESKAVMDKVTSFVWGMPKDANKVEGAQMTEGASSAVDTGFGAVVAALGLALWTW